MKNGKPTNKAIIAVCLALLLVLTLAFGLFVFARPSSSRVEITLPDKGQSDSFTDDNEFLDENSLLQITAENAATALASLNKPLHYHQVYSATTGSVGAQTTSRVDLWVNGSLVRAQVENEYYNKTILSDGENVCLWYSFDTQPVFLTLDDQITFEDLIGVPSFDYLHSFDQATVTDAEYLLIGDEPAQVSCIFMSLLKQEDTQMRYWINLGTGLLYEADSIEGSDQVYHIKQTSFDRLVDGDETFADKFLLPDGSDPFNAAAESIVP